MAHCIPDDDDEDADSLLLELQYIHSQPALLDLARRQLHGEVILNHPYRFHVCEGCESLTLKEIDICPVCQGLHFDASIKKVLENAEILSNQERTLVIESDLE